MKMRLHSLEVTSPEDHPSSDVPSLLIREEAPDIGGILAVIMKDSMMIHE
jgi:hypothetical protein